MMSGKRTSYKEKRRRRSVADTTLQNLKMERLDLASIDVSRVKQLVLYTCGGAVHGSKQSAILRGSDTPGGRDSTTSFAGAKPITLRPIAPREDLRSLILDTTRHLSHIGSYQAFVLARSRRLLSPSIELAPSFWARRPSPPPEMSQSPPSQSPNLTPQFCFSQNALRGTFHLPTLPPPSPLKAKAAPS